MHVSQTPQDVTTSVAGDDGPDDILSHWKCLRREQPLHIYLANYLDENEDGAVSQEEFVDKKAMPMIRSIFAALDRNSDGVVELSEAWMENILSPPFLRYLTAELFKFGDLNKDDYLSNEDIPRAIRPGWLGHTYLDTIAFVSYLPDFTGPRHVRWPEVPRGHGTIYYEYKGKFNKSFDICIVLWHYGPGLQEKCSRLMLEFLPEVDRQVARLMTRLIGTNLFLIFTMKEQRRPVELSRDK